MVHLSELVSIELSGILVTKMEQENKLGILARSGAFFVAIASAFAFIAACIGLLTDGFEKITIIGVLVSLTFIYIFGVIGFTGHPPKILNWTR